MRAEPTYANLKRISYTPIEALFVVHLCICIRDSIEVSISACHAEGPGSIPGLGVFMLFHLLHLCSTIDGTAKNISVALYFDDRKKPYVRSKMCDVQSRLYNVEEVI